MKCFRWRDSNVTSLESRLLFVDYVLVPDYFPNKVVYENIIPEENRCLDSEFRERKMVAFP